MLNLTDTLTRIKLDIGIYGMVLPFENGDQFLVDVIKYKTIPTYSRYSPYRIDVRIPFDRLEAIDRYDEAVVYLLPKTFTERTISTIEKVVPYQNHIGSIGYGTSVSYCDMKDMMLGAQNAFLANFISPKMSFKFIEPNRIVLYNFPNTDLLFTIGYYHDYNLSTIDEGHGESFMALALLDIKAALYNAMRNYDEIQTSYGTVKLRTDEWQSAESDRRDLLEKWGAYYHLDSTPLYFVT